MKLELDVSDEVLAERKAKWQPREPKVTTGYLKRYAALVTSGNRGAILALPGEQNAYVYILIENSVRISFYLLS